MRNLQEEINSHVFFSCSYVKEVWRISGLPNQQINSDGCTENLKEVLRNVNK